MSQVNGFRGLVSYGIRELNQDETCGGSIMSALPFTNKSVMFTSDFMIRSFNSGCYYLDIATGRWSSSEMEILPDSYLDMTHCITKRF